jgi:hypothetical protein
VQLAVKDGRITDIKGGDEAEALRRFLAEMRGRLGDGVYDMNALHFGVHPHLVLLPLFLILVMHDKIAAFVRNACQLLPKLLLTCCNL